MITKAEAHAVVACQTGTHSRAQDLVDYGKYLGEIR